MSEVLVIQDKMKPAREKRPIEVKWEDISKHHINLGYYQLLSSTPEIAKHYIRKLEYIQLVMGTENILNLNPRLYVCQIKNMHAVS